MQKEVWQEKQLPPTKRRQIKFPHTTNKIIEEKGYMSEKVFNTDKYPILEKKNVINFVSMLRYLFIRKRREPQDLRQEAIG